MVKRKYIKLPSWYYGGLLIIVIGGFISAIIYSTWQVKKYVAILPDEEIPEVVLTSPVEYGYLRDAVFYKPDHFIPEAILIGVECNEDADYAHQGIDAKKLTVAGEKLRYKLSDVSLPFTLSKGSDSIIHVKKDNCKMTFRLLKYDGPYQK